jgi:hypothetical protein
MTKVLLGGLQEPHRKNRRVGQPAFGFALILASLFFGELTGGQTKGGGCDKPLKIAAQPRSPDESAKLKIFKTVGAVMLLVDEEGNVSDLKVQSVHPEVAREPLISVAKTVKFAPRRGCGSLQILMLFSGDQPGKLQ